MGDAKRQVQYKNESCEVDSMSGAKIHEVRRKVKERVNDNENGLLVIQDGGNDLENIGTEETAKEVVEAVKAVEFKNVSVTVMGIMRWSREAERYKRIRVRINVRLREEMLKMKIEWLKKGKENVSFLHLVC